ncbi:MAG TPA: hypothetical protein VFL57_02825 [Bryobacteraceae bacterium]|nr:hypothetical protein [Bryobacteraceae bacterium]
MPAGKKRTAEKNVSGKDATAEQVAEAAKPNWRAVPREVMRAYDAPPAAAPDATAPELDALHKKYFGDAPARAARRTARGDVQMVVMEPKTAADTRVGRKTALVSEGKVIGEQG